VPRLVKALAGGGLTAGVATSFGALRGSLSPGEEHYLYKPLYGAGPLVGVLAVAAHQVAGDSPVFPAPAPRLLYSQLPLARLAVAAVSPYLPRSSRDFAATLLATLTAWAYLRFRCAYAGGIVGDMRPEFSFLSMLPAPLRYVLIWEGGTMSCPRPATQSLTPTLPHTPQDAPAARGTPAGRHVPVAAALSPRTSGRGGAGGARRRRGHASVWRCERCRFCRRRRWW